MKKIIKIIEYLVVFSILLLVCFYINKDIVVKGLFKDDLFHWSWFRGLNLFDFAFKFYESTKYRPAFEVMQYIVYTIAGTSVEMIIVQNKVFNAIIALFIYHFIKKLDVNRIIAILIASFYLVSHYAYYQIGQGIGNLESGSLFFSIITLFYCLKLSGVILKKDQNGEYVLPTNKDNILNTIMVFIMYFIASFVHERFMCIGLTVFLAIMFSRCEDGKKINKRKIISVIIFILEIVLICFIRFMATKRLLPPGTGGTYVENTFKIDEFIRYCFEQVAIILGINIGPDYLYGIDFVSLADSKVKYITMVSIALIFILIFVYIIKRFNNDSKRNLLAGDLLFLTFIASCIGASSVTIRVELRFVYASFTVAVIYLCYMGSVLWEGIDKKVTRIVVSLVIALIVFARLPIELVYRSYYPKIYCVVDTLRMNSIYDNTIGRYGLDDILHNRKIYLIDEYYGMTKFYAEYFFKIYDKDNVGNEIKLVKKYTDIPIEDINENTIVLYEDLTTSVYAVAE